MLRAAIAIVFVLSVPALASAQADFDRIWRWLSPPSDPYPLDEIPRHTAEEGALACPEVELVRVRGDIVRYDRSLRVAAPFAPKLRELEEVVREVATRFYGRAPRRIHTLGTYACRRVRGRPYRMSEHALGNGIDVSGFSFPAAPREARDALARPLRGPFTVTVERHWYPRRERDALHSEFLRELTRELARRGVFRAMLGPRHRFHRNHFHFDYGPFRYRIL
jgi:hypothetical protein